MTIHAMGDYYLWYCDRCDSTNQTHWSRLGHFELACAACHLPARFTPPAGERLKAA